MKVICEHIKAMANVDSHHFETLDILQNKSTIQTFMPIIPGFLTKCQLLLCSLKTFEILLGAHHQTCELLLCFSANM